MQGRSISPNEVTLVALISGCADLGASAQCVWARAYALKNQLKLNRFIITSSINLYAKCGCFDIARQLFDEFPQRDTLCYNAVIRGTEVNEYGRDAVKLFDQMKTAGLSPDEVIVLITMCACSHTGLVYEGYNIFAMEEEYAIKPKLEHYCCLSDLWRRAGCLEKAVRRIKAMPMSPYAAIWRGLLGSSTVHGNLEISESALRHLIEIQPETSENYVFSSKMYARTGQWDDVNNVRRLMKDRALDN